MPYSLVEGFHDLSFRHGGIGKWLAWIAIRAVLNDHTKIIEDFGVDRFNRFSSSSRLSLPPVRRCIQIFILYFIMSTFKSVGIYSGDSLHIRLSAIASLFHDAGKKLAPSRFIEQRRKTLIKFEGEENSL